MANATIEKNTTDLYPSREGEKSQILYRQDPVVHGNVPGPLSAQELQQYEENGFLTFSQLFSEDELQPYIDELKRLQSDPAVKKEDTTITEPDSGEVRSVFAIDIHNEVMRKICHHPRLVKIARQLLGGDVYLHQSRINFKPGFKGNGFYWHSDFETWHVEDGMPRMRAVSCSVSLTENFDFNGPLMVIPGSHKKYLSCVGKTPENNYKKSLKQQEIGVPDPENLAKMAEEGGIVTAKGAAGSVIFFECNIMHGSNSNITPYPRSNIFMVFNSIENQLVEPFCGLPARPDYIAKRGNIEAI